MFRTKQLVIRALARSMSQAAKTPLYDFHVKQGGKMVPFAGYLMPVQYGSHSISDSHKHTRKSVSIFDVSHMLQTKVHGSDRVKFYESLVPADIEGLQQNTGTLTVYTTASGGIIDDLIVSKTADYLYVVSNAGCADKDLAHVLGQAKNYKSVEIEKLDGHALIAVQGPAAHNVLSALASCDMNSLKFMNTIECDVAGIPCRVTRCGYTGEDGVEISVGAKQAEEVVKALLASKAADVKLAGLGARDTLRLEAGLCLYGNDIDENTTPIEANLAWLIQKRRRAEGGFPGHDIIMKQLREKPSKRRVGFTLGNGPPARQGAKIFQGATEIGVVTSGCPAPTAEKNIAMGYVSSEFAKVGTEVQVKIRNSTVNATVTKMPFVATHYFQ